MGFERHVISSTAKPVASRTKSAALPEDAPAVTPLRKAAASREAETLQLARQMRGEWRKERYSRLAGH